MPCLLQLALLYFQLSGLRLTPRRFEVNTSPTAARVHAWPFLLWVPPHQLGAVDKDKDIIQLCTGIVLTISTYDCHIEALPIDDANKSDDVMLCNVMKCNSMQCDAMWCDVICMYGRPLVLCLLSLVVLPSCLSLCPRLCSLSFACLLLLCLPCLPLSSCSASAALLWFLVVLRLSCLGFLFSGLFLSWISKLVL